jgi:hypothetical protein
VNSAGLGERPEPLSRQRLSLGQGGEEGGCPGRVGGALRQVEVRAAVRGDHLALLQGERREGGPPAGRAPGDQRDQPVGPGFGREFAGDRLQ